MKVSRQIAVLAQLAVFHSVDGYEVAINPALVTSVIAAKGTPNKLLTDSVRCIVNLADGKIVTIAESCDVVRRRLEETKK